MTLEEYVAAVEKLYRAVIDAPSGGAVEFAIAELQAFQRAHPELETAHIRRWLLHRGRRMLAAAETWRYGDPVWWWTPDGPVVEAPPLKPSRDEWRVGR